MDGIYFRDNCLYMKRAALAGAGICLVCGYTYCAYITKSYHFASFSFYLVLLGGPGPPSLCPVVASGGGVNGDAEVLTSFTFGASRSASCSAE